MASGISHLKIKKLLIFSSTGKMFDLSNSIADMDYFESILEPVVTMKIDLFNVFSLFNEIPIRGGERVELELENGSNIRSFYPKLWTKKTPKSFLLEGDNSLYVYKVSNISNTGQKELLTIHLISEEYFLNEQSKCLKKYYSNNISTHVDDILKNDLGTVKDCYIDDTSNRYVFIGSNRKPFHVLQWLAPKSISTSSGVKGTSGDGKNAEGKGTAGFMFYENKDGFNFKSIDALVDKSQSLTTREIKRIWTYTYTSVIESSNTENNLKIIKFEMEKNIDLRKSLRVGMYHNQTDYYDANTNKLHRYTYKLPSEIEEKTLAEDPVESVFDTRSSRYMFRISDHGVMQPNGEIEETGRDHADMAKSFARKKVGFTQSLNILVPCNTNLKVGDIIQCIFPRLKQGKSNSPDPKMSGFYLIRELRHHFEANKNTTSLKLMRDSYGLY